MVGKFTSLSQIFIRIHPHRQFGCFSQILIFHPLIRAWYDICYLYLYPLYHGYIIPEGVAQCCLIESGKVLLQGPSPNFSNFWYYKKAHYYVAHNLCFSQLYGTFHSCRVFHLEDFNGNVSIYGKHKITQ